MESAATGLDGAFSDLVVLGCARTGVIADAAGPLEDVLGRADVVGRSIDEVLPGEQAQRWFVASADEHDELELVLAWEDAGGVTREVEVRWTIQPGGESALGRCRALHGRRRGHRHVARVMASSDFLGAVAHDLSNPLAAILGYCQLIRLQTEDAKLVQYAEIALDQAQRCRDLVGGLQSTVVTRTPALAAISARDVISAALAFRSDAIADAKVEVDDQVPEGLRLCADLDLIRRALGHLFDNAIAAMQRAQGPSVLTLQAGRERRRIFIDVRDNGPGVSPELRDRIFDPAVTTRRTGSGSGVGLATALAILQRHGGDVRLLDTSEHGATFRILLPAPEVLGTDAAAPARERAEAARVLCVDPEAFMVELLEEIITALGFAATPLQTREDADALLAEGRYAAVIGRFGPLLEAVWEVARSWPDARLVVYPATTPASVELGSFVERTGAALLRRPFSLLDVKRVLDLG